MVTDTERLYGCTSEADLLVDALRRYPERIAIRTGERDISYAEIEAEISRYAKALRALGIERGDRVGLLGGNKIPIIYVTQAANMLGCVIVPLHPRGSLNDHIYVAKDAGLKALAFDTSEPYASRALELGEHGVAILASLGPQEGASDLMALAAEQVEEPLVPPILGPDEVCRLSYSGGTTGEPKAIMGTPRVLLTKTMIQLTQWEWPAEVRQLVVAPLSHAGGAMLLPTLTHGGTLHVLPNFDPREVLATIERERISCVLLIPTMIAALLDHPEIDDFDLTSLEVVYYGASPISPARLRQGIARLGKVFFQFYGQTEAPMTVTVLRRDEHDVDDDRRLSSCGRPVPLVRVALLDDDGHPVPEGEPGEICVQGPLVMKGYWNKPEQTAEALKDGWLRSGDVAVRLPGGFLQIVDRKKDMIISGGFNVFAREVEDVIAEHPGVAACAVIGVPDAKWGETVKAVVVRHDGAAIEAEEISALVRERKGAVQAPRIVEFVDALPLTSLGKPDKKSLRQAARAVPVD